MSKPVCVVVGVGPGNGASFARAFAGAGYAVALLARSTETTEELAGELADARAYSCDVTDNAAIERVFAAIADQMGPVDCMIYNAGSGVWGSVDEVTVDGFEKAWQINARGLLVAAKQVMPAMVEAGRGNIVVVGATASLRGGAKFTAFASAKAAQRNLTQSIARHLWPRGVHVSLLIIDGVVDLERTRQMMPDKSDDFFLQPDDIAGTVLAVTEQPKSAWSFEFEVRPFGEKW
jgi:NADP-dependent 3-hydroxy acid dehydrogenase YdfG